MSENAFSNQIRVIVVEDDCLIAADMTAMIEEAGAGTVVCQAMNRQEAMTCARGWSPEAAFVDINLEDGRTGPEIGAMLSEMGIAVIYATGNPEQIPSAGPGLAAAVKPVSSQSVVHALELIAAHRESRPAPKFSDDCRLVLPPFGEVL